MSCGEGCDIERGRGRGQQLGLDGFLSDLVDGAWLGVAGCHMMGTPLRNTEYAKERKIQFYS